MFNAFSGDVVCSKCQHVFSFSAIEKFFTKSHRSTDLDRARDLFLRSKPKPNILTAATIHKDAVPVSQMLNLQLQSVFQHLGLSKIEPDTLLGLNAFCYAKRKVLYFPMLDVESNIVGYKRLSRLPDADLTETTLPEQNSFGAVIFHPLKRGFREQRTAILVVNMLDALALRSQKNNGEQTIRCHNIHKP